LYIGPKSRIERPRKTEIGTEVAHVARDSDHHFEGQKVNVQLLADVLNSPHAGAGATWRINANILSTYRGGDILWRSLAQLVPVYLYATHLWLKLGAPEGGDDVSCRL